MGEWMTVPSAEQLVQLPVADVTEMQCLHRRELQRLLHFI